MNTIELPLLKNERLFQITADASGGVAKSTEQNVHQDTKQEEVEEINTQVWPLNSIHFPSRKKMNPSPRSLSVVKN